MADAMTIRDWMIRLIRSADRSSRQSRYHECRLRAAERARVLRFVLRHLERASLDLEYKFVLRR